MRIGCSICGIAVALCFGLGQLLEKHRYLGSIEPFLSEGIFSGRVDAYASLSPETLPYFFATLIVFIPASLACWTVAAMRYRPLDRQPPLSFLEILIASIFFTAMVLLSVYGCFILVPADFDGLGGLFTYPFLPFMGIGVAWMSTAAFIQFLPLLALQRRVDK